MDTQLLKNKTFIEGRKFQAKVDLDRFTLFQDWFDGLGLSEMALLGKVKDGSKVENQLKASIAYRFDLKTLLVAVLEEIKKEAS